MTCSTENLYLGAYLLNEGAELRRVSVSRANGRTMAVFELEGSAVGEGSEAFYAERAVVNLAAYRRHLEALKDELFDALRGGSDERRGSKDEESQSQSKRQPRYRLRSRR